MDIKDFTKLQMTNIVKNGKNYYRIIYRHNDNYVLQNLSDNKDKNTVTLCKANYKNFEFVK